MSPRVQGCAVPEALKFTLGKTLWLQHCWGPHVFRCWCRVCLAGGIWLTWCHQQHVLTPANMASAAGQQAQYHKPLCITAVVAVSSPPWLLGGLCTSGTVGGTVSVLHKQQHVKLMHSCVQA
jgi:hypothetical protein